MKESVRQRRARRIAQAMSIVDQLGQHTKECNDVWWSQRRDHTDDAVWLTTPFAVNARGDSPLAESNYRVIRADLDRVAGMHIDYRVDAWPGGTIHTLMVRADDALALREVERWAAALADYPVADDADLAELEAEQLAQEWTEADNL